MNEERIYKASELAKLFSVDLKTIHNWTNKGRIPSFRTPGRHLRFHAKDVDALLAACGQAPPTDTETTATAE